MRPRLFALIALLFSSWWTGCQRTTVVSGLTQVIYSSRSGTILPERQWSETYTITSESVRLERKGAINGTLVNAGSWRLTADGDTIAELFSALEDADYRSMTRVEADDQPDGGTTEAYTLSYSDSTSYELLFAPGTVYTNVGQITEPVDAFLKALVWPDDARDRYRIEP